MERKKDDYQHQEKGQTRGGGRNPSLTKALVFSARSIKSNSGKWAGCGVGSNAKSVTKKAGVPTLGRGKPHSEARRGATYNRRKSSGQNTSQLKKTKTIAGGGRKTPKKGERKEVRKEGGGKALNGTPRNAVLARTPPTGLLRKATAPHIKAGKQPNRKKSTPAERESSNAKSANEFLQFGAITAYPQLKRYKRKGKKSLHTPRKGKIKRVELKKTTSRKRGGEKGKTKISEGDYCKTEVLGGDCMLRSVQTLEKQQKKRVDLELIIGEPRDGT